MSITPAGEPFEVEAIAAALRADTADLDVYARVLSTSLAEGLPAGMVTVDRNRSLGDRMAGRPGVVAAVHIAVGDWQLELLRGRGGAPDARVARRVRGVVISSKQVSIEEWVQMLAHRLAEAAQASAEARAALGRLLGQSG